MQQVLVCHTDRPSWIYDALIRHLGILQDNSCMKWRYVEWKEGRKRLGKLRWDMRYNKPSNDV